MSSSIWVESEAAWKLLAPVGFPDEATLHRLVEEAPQLLPLSGSPRLVVLGHEVPLGSGSADILAVEPSGRLVLLEVKLARNAEARRAVVAQILAYAAYLRGTSVEALEQQTLRRQLRERGVETIAALAESEDPDGTFDGDAFAESLEESLVAGRFRLVLVLDDAPAELVRLVGYLESIAPELVIDLVAMSAYDINGARALVPQRIEPERQEMQSAASSSPSDRKKRAYAITPEEFEQSIEDAPEQDRAPLHQMFEWARGLEREGVLRLSAVRGTSGATTLRPCLLNDEAGLITIWNAQHFSITLWRSVFERRAPGSIDRVEAVIAPARVGNGNAINEVSEQLLDSLADAYREAARPLPNAPANG
jgi:hypothetical protein